MMHSKKLTIRRARHQDAEAIIQVHGRSIREICTHHYTAEQISAWAGRRFMPKLWCQAMDRDLIWVIEDGGQVRGFGHLAIMDEKTAEVMALYFTPESCGQGAGKMMLELFKQQARSRGIREIQLHATLNAKKFYERSGFLQNAGDTSIEMQGVAIPCVPMVCNLY